MILAADLLHAVRETRKRSSPDCISRGSTHLHTGGDRGQRILGIVLATQRTDVLERCDPAEAAVFGAHKAGAVCEQTVVSGNAWKRG